MKQITTILLLLACISLSAQQDTVIKKVEYPAGYEARIDVIYSRVNGWEGREDIYFNPKASKPTPVVFNIHGGGWNHGTKESQTGFASFFKQGYAVVNVEYRLVQVAPAPAAVEDVRAALLYVVKHAKELNIDPHKIVMMGGSAGGHLALMGGLLQKDHRFDGEYKNVNDFTIAAIVDKYGLADFAFPGIEKYKSEMNWLGDYTKDPAKVQSVSPVYYVKKSSPPTIIIHGDADPRIPYEQSVALHKKYLEAGAPVKFITVEGGLHGNFPQEKNREVNNAIMAFLKSYGL
ncbi:alpha/beta hydrolase [Sediminibacterium ginsengisoli]|uniref:Acetyl esterase/lipase n=1 Tax=Sediminibacterium ginsengisoli TaxID=413434 RepID=A0A1T4P9Z6_9BACT|nr:alpha/beta hydrolase [Sediminibacterium ginsengisoli]SJZ88211.1 Acetyl esterase/lipase [Sediminibacterium ginsengisoli]